MLTKTLVILNLVAAASFAAEVKTFEGAFVLQDNTREISFLRTADKTCVVHYESDLARAGGIKVWSRINGTESTTTLNYKYGLAFEGPVACPAYGDLKVSMAFVNSKNAWDNNQGANYEFVLR